jgi:hypothetical protein
MPGGIDMPGSAQKQGFVSKYIMEDDRLARGACTIMKKCYNEKYRGYPVLSRTRRMIDAEGQPA